VGEKMKNSVKTPLKLLGITSAVFGIAMAFMWGVLGLTHLFMSMDFVPYGNRPLTMDDLHDFVNAQWLIGTIWAGFILFYGVRILWALLRKEKSPPMPAPKPIERERPCSNSYYF
jgi:hypothetical protein